MLNFRWLEEYQFPVEMAARPQWKVMMADRGLQVGLSQTIVLTV